MIAFFPQVIPGETFESIVTRLSKRIAAQGGFLKGRYFPGDTVAGRFSPTKLVENLAVPEWLPLSRLLEENTPLPVIRPFLDAKDCARISRQLVTSERSVTVTRMLAPRRRFCCDCRTTELEGLADVCWQVLHQIRWIWRCQTHQGVLWQLAPESELKGVARPVDTGCRDKRDFDALKAIERDTKWLVGARVPPLGRQRWKNFHRWALTQRFGIKPPYASRPLFSIAHRIPPRARAWLRLPMISHLDNWLLTAARCRSGTTDPLLHLATLRLCGIKVSDAVRLLPQISNEPNSTT